jgi:FkbM family methyltransferase
MASVFLVDLIEQVQSFKDEDIAAFTKLVRRYMPHFDEISQRLYERLCADERQRFVVWFLKRWGGIDRVNPVEMALYLDNVNLVKQQTCERVSINDKSYKVQDLNLQGYDFKLAAYDWVLSIHDVFYNQYEHKDFCIRRGDVIIDAGGFIGDTAALFCVKTGNDCQVHSFELLDENIALFEHNNRLNGIADQVRINKLALSDKSGDVLTIKPAALQGATSLSASEGPGDKIATITLDDYVIEHKLSRVDLIKMDIEGSEIPALRGAINTIRHFKPRLALCLYHKWDDVITIPRFLAETGVDYRFNFKWVQLFHGWEAVMLAEPLDPAC